MNRALWLLLGLQLRGWGRNLVRSLGTVKGVLLAAVGLGVFLLWFGSLILTTGTPAYTHDQIREWGPAGLLFYCLLNVVSTPGERAIYFSPGEVNFLFPGPFGRRELLGYKITLQFVFSLPTALFMTFVFQIYAHTFVAAFVGLLLTYQFMQLFVTAVNLAASAVGARLFSFGRRIAVLAVVALVLAIAWQAGWTQGQGSVGEVLARAVKTDVWRTVSRPLSYFFDAFLSENLWPDLAWNALLALTVDLVLLAVVFGLDAEYLEASASASARIYARLQRMRRVGPSGAARGGKALFRLPMAPWWGGAGPIFWRQLTTATRGAGRLLTAMVIFALAMTGMWTGLNGQNQPEMAVDRGDRLRRPHDDVPDDAGSVRLPRRRGPDGAFEDAADAGVAAGPGRGAGAGADLHADPVGGAGRDGRLLRPNRPVAAGRRRLRPSVQFRAFRDG